MYICVYVYVYVYLCVHGRAQLTRDTCFLQPPLPLATGRRVICMYTHIHKYIYIYIYVCVCI